MIDVTPMTEAEKEYVRRVPPHLYVSVEAADELCSRVDCAYHPLPLDGVESAPALKALYGEAGMPVPERAGAWNAGFIPSPDKKSIWQRVHHGKYAPTGVLIHEIGHLLSYEFHDDDPLEMLSYIEELRAELGEGLAKDFQEAVAWVLGGLFVIACDDNLMKGVLAQIAFESRPSETPFTELVLPTLILEDRTLCRPKSGSDPDWYHRVNRRGFTVYTAFREYGRRLVALDPDWEGGLWPEIRS